MCIQWEQDNHTAFEFWQGLFVTRFRERRKQAVRSPSGGFAARGCKCKTAYEPRIAALPSWPSAIISAPMTSLIRAVRRERLLVRSSTHDLCESEVPCAAIT